MVCGSEFGSAKFLFGSCVRPAAWTCVGWLGKKVDAVGDSLGPAFAAVAEVKGSLRFTAYWSLEEVVDPLVVGPATAIANLIGVAPLVMILKGAGALADLALMLLGENEVSRVSGVPLNDSATPLDDSGELALNLVSRP